MAFIIFLLLKGKSGTKIMALRVHETLDSIVRINKFVLLILHFIIFCSYCPWTMVDRDVTASQHCSLFIFVHCVGSNTCSYYVQSLPDVLKRQLQFFSVGVAQTSRGVFRPWRVSFATPVCYKCIQIIY